MTFTFKHRLVLGLAGLVALIIGLAITMDPQTFYASYGIVISPQPNLMSELRAPAANLAALGLIILTSAVFQKLVLYAARLGTTVFFAFAAGRTISILLDGWPSESILAAFAIEIALGLLCMWVALGAKPDNEADGSGVITV